MELTVAKNLIQKGVDSLKPDQVWADLGAGDGLFTNALAALLPSNSKIISIDRDERALKNISVGSSGVKLQTLVGDLNDLPDSLPLFDGIVMANSLHYVKDQNQFLLKLKSAFKKSGVLMLIEYDLEKSNPWVPYPISKRKVADLAISAQFQTPVFLGSVPSKLNSSEIYSVLLKPKA
jgi:ubiquinone/menaquinone biosynthesis C-methylase UbiE